MKRDGAARVLVQDTLIDCKCSAMGKIHAGIDCKVDVSEQLDGSNVEAVNNT